MSADLQWLVIRKNNSFLVHNKVGGRDIFSKEANNLTNTHSFKASGLVNSKTVGVSANGNKGLVLSTKNRNQSRPRQVQTSVKLTRGARHANKAVKGATSKYRQDLQRAALARASAILRSQKVKAKKVRSGRKTAKAAKPAATA
eukprot:m.197684 g.197684  ORF g.197684 m.197684 type:complete len:144 (+) comp17668_c0_seq5:444-875(+)